MKKLTTIIAMMLFIVQVSFAQTPTETHWKPDVHQFQTNATLTSAIYIGEEFQNNPYLELGAFCGDELRGAVLPQLFPPTQQYVWSLMVYGNNNDVITFKVYDHESGEEIELSCETSYTFQVDDIVGNAFNPYQVSFTESSTTVTINATANPEEGGTIDGTGEYNINDTVTLTAIENDGYAFVNWTENNVVVSDFDEYTFTATEDRDLVAHFALINYTLTINYTGAGDDTPEPHVETLTYGTAYSVQSPVLDCYDVDIANVEGTMPAEDVTVTVTYTIKTHTLTINYTGAGEATPKQHTETVNCGEGYSILTPEVVGYTPDIFTVEGTMQDEDVTVTVTYTINEYVIEVEANPEEGGTVTGGGTYSYSDEVTIVATPNESYSFVNWTFDDEEVTTEPSYTFNVDDDMLFTANFELKTYTVTATADPETGGTVEGQGTFSHGETAELTATANDTYSFLHWTVNNEIVSNEATYSFEVTSDVEVVAHFKQITYEITATANPSDGGTITGAGPYVLNSEATLTASPNTNFKFLNWTENNEVISREATISFDVTGPRNLVANFSPCQTITLKQGQNYFSTYIEVSGVSGMKKLQAALGTKAKSIKSKTKTTTYYAGYGWYGTLKEINNKEMYIITMKQAATITLVGDIVDPTTQEIVIMKGTNYIGYPCTTDNQSLASALANMTPTKGDMIKSQTQSAVYNNGSWRGTLKSFNTGKGYIYTSKKPQTYGFYFPSNNNKGEIAFNEEDPHWEPIIYNHYMSVFGILTINGTEHSGDDQYEIGAFVNGECRGDGTAFVYDDESGKYIYMFDIYGNANEQVYFDIYDRTNEVECDYVCTETITFVEEDGEDNPYNIGTDENPHYIAFVDGAMITVSANPAIGGTVTGGGRYAAGTNVTVTAAASSNYTFVNWTEDNVEQTTNTSYEFTASTRRNLVANFTKTSSNYDIVTSVGGTAPEQASITTNMTSAAAGQTITVSTTCNEGYLLLGLKYYETGTDPEETGVEIENNQFTMPPYDVTITAECYLDETEYTVTAAQGIVNGTISSDKESGIYNTEVTITATPDEYGFLESLYYTKEGSSDHINIDLGTKKFNMPQANVTIYAQFALRGDSNADNVVNILDVVNTARKVLGQTPDHFKLTCADVNQDNIIDVNDITGTANVAINRGVAECYDYEGGYYVENGMLTIETDVAVAGIQVELDAETATFANLEGFTTGAAWVDGNYLMLAYSIDNTLEAGTHQIMQIGRANIKRVIVSTAGGCNVNMSYGHLGITENVNGDIQIYPNPANYYVRIDGNGIEKITVTNIMGQVVIDNEVCSDDEVIDISSLCKGAYLFRVVTADGIFTKEVIITQ